MNPLNKWTRHRFVINSAGKFLLAGMLLSSFVFNSCTKSITEQSALRTASRNAGEVWSGISGSTTAPAASLCEAQTFAAKSYPFVAGQTIGSGTLDVYNDKENLYLKVCGATFQEVESNLKIWVGVSGDLLPSYIDGNPIPGQFPIHLTVPQGADCYYVTIPFSSIEGYNGSPVNCASKLSIYMHGDVVAGGSSQTAWAGDCKVDPGKKGGGGKWYRYVCGYQAACCPEDPPVFPCDGYTQTAFAKGNYVFTTDGKSNPDNLPSLRLTRNRWGWAINLTSATPDLGTNYLVYAGAGLNQISKGTLVGTLNVQWNGTTANVTYSTNGDFQLSGLHLYASDIKPATIAPGQYGNTVSFEPRVSTYTFTNLPLTDTNQDGVWIIAHAGVFGVYGPCPQ